MKHGALPLATQVKSQHARGARYFIGDSWSALDIYCTAFANLLDPLPKEHVRCPKPGARPSSPPTRSSSRRSTRCCWSTVREYFASTSAILWSCNRCAFESDTGKLSPRPWNAAQLLA